VVVESRGDEFRVVSAPYRGAVFCADGCGGCGALMECGGMWRW
jgi:hypothetical protein